jgi:hypothetical protein
VRDGFSHVERWNARKVGRDGCKAPHDCLFYFLLWIFVSNRSPYLLLLDGLLFSFYVFRSLVFIWYNHLVCFFSSPPIGHIFFHILGYCWSDSRIRVPSSYGFSPPPVSFVVFFFGFDSSRVRLGTPLSPLTAWFLLIGSMHGRDKTRHKPNSVQYIVQFHLPLLSRANILTFRVWSAASFFIFLRFNFENSDALQLWMRPGRNRTDVK